MAERWAKGLCYNCDETYSFRHRCKKLFCVELEEDAIGEFPELVSDEPAISLYAISGLKIYKRRI
uniref:Uncharacterized protein n=1 Tax=Manihot esculenta TaxID=3983 RepID=A0A2C9W0C0_MANES